MRKKLNIGCTAERHKQIGIHAVINARGGNQHLNDLTQEDIEMKRDARKVSDKLNNRVRFYQFNSKHFRKAETLKHLLNDYNEI